jgi:hypothetical protein
MMPVKRFNDLLLEAVQNWRMQQESGASSFPSSYINPGLDLRRLSLHRGIEQSQQAESDGYLGVQNNDQSAHLIQAGVRGRTRPAPSGPMSVPPIPVPPLPEWWNVIKPIWEMYRRSLPGGGYGRPDDEYNQCMRAAGSGTTEWEEFCRRLGIKQQRAGCWANTYERPQERRNWCEREFGTDD